MRLVVLISGNGSNLQAILDAVRSGGLDARVELVVSNRKDAYGLVRAAQAAVPTLYFPLKPYTAANRSRDEYDADLAQLVAARQPELVVLAGWMHIFGPAFLDRFPGRVINLHPALPGAFPGAHAIADAYTAYQRGEISHSGCMIHTVIPALDAGPVIAERVVPFEPGDTLDDFEARMHAAEHELIVKAIRLCRPMGMPPGRPRAK